MISEELYQQFLSRYDGIIRNTIDRADIRRLSDMIKRVMRWMSVNEPGLAAQAIAILDGEDTKQCHNQLSEQEARAIVEQMDPKPRWELDELKKTLEGMGLPTDVPPHFNRWALLTTMLMKKSDEGESLKAAIHANDRDERLARLIYNLAVNDLEDEDGHFRIRRYFKLER